MSILLSTLINDQNNYQTLQQIPEENKVRFIDQALKAEVVDYKLPFRRRKTTLKIFDDVLFYASPSDYDSPAFLDNDEDSYSERGRFVFRSFEEFLEKKDERNHWGEIYDNGTIKIGVDYKLKNGSSRVLNNAEIASDWSVSNDATAIAKDAVFYKEGNASMKVTVVNSAGSATIEGSFTSFTDTNYLRKYQFFYIYMPSALSSITLRYGNDNLNYLYTAVTTQFDGSAFEAGAWNLIAQDLNTATTIGTITSSAFDYQAFILTGASSGTYWVDTSYLRQWELLDLWYNSNNSVVLADLTTEQELFYNPSTEAYVATSRLIGPREWANYINLHAMLLGAMDKNDNSLFSKISFLIYGGVKNGKIIKGAEEKLKDRYISSKPVITNTNWRWQNDPTAGRIRTIGNYDF